MLTEIFMSAVTSKNGACVAAYVERQLGRRV
jgi:hypothetical protein